MVISPSWLASPTGQAVTDWLLRAMFTSASNSSTVTSPFPPQSPTQGVVGLGVGGAVGLGVTVGEPVGVTVAGVPVMVRVAVAVATSDAVGVAVAPPTTVRVGVGGTGVVVGLGAGVVLRVGVVLAVATIVRVAVGGGAEAWRCSQKPLLTANSPPVMAPAAGPESG